MVQWPYSSYGLALYGHLVSFRIWNHEKLMASPDLQNNKSTLNKSANNNAAPPPPPQTWSNLMAITQTADVWLSYQCLHLCQNGVYGGLCVNNIFLSVKLSLTLVTKVLTLRTPKTIKAHKVVTVRFHYPVLWSHFYHGLATLRYTVSPHQLEF